MIKPNLLLVLSLTLPAIAQTTVKDSLAKHWKTSGEFTMAVAKEMPAESYGFRPVPEEMSFGQLMVHIAGANLRACANASGMKAPPVPAAILQQQKEQKPDIDKDTAIQFVTQSFDFCNDAVASMTPEKLDAVVGPENRKMTGFEWLWAYFTHTAHHRGQAEVYLRAKGIKPPSYTF
ncbi:MAG: DinB family protein [Bryobacteraceae bacterium]